MWRRYQAGIVQNMEVPNKEKLGRTSFLSICRLLTVKEIRQRGALDGVSHSCGTLNFARMLHLLDSIESTNPQAEVRELLTKARPLVVLAQRYLKTEYKQHVMVALRSEDPASVCCTHSPYFGLCTSCFEFASLSSCLHYVVPLFVNV